MNLSDFDLPAEFTIYEPFIKENKDTFNPLLTKYLQDGNTLFKAIVFASEELADQLPVPSIDFQEIYSEIALIGYFLLSQYERVLKFKISSRNFRPLYFLFKAAVYLNNAQSKEFFSTLIQSVAEMKKSDNESYNLCNNIISLELASMNSDLKGIKKHARNFKHSLFQHSLLKGYSLVTIQVVSDLAYRELRTGDPDFIGWLEMYKELAEAFNMDTKRLDCYSMIAGLYQYKGYFQDAREYYDKAMDIAKKIGTKRYQTTLSTEIAELESASGNLGKSLELSKEALRSTSLDSSKSSIFINIADILIKQEKYSEAIEYLRKAEIITKPVSPIVKLLQGYALTKVPGKDNFNKGVELLEKGRALSEKSNNFRHLTVYYYLRGVSQLENYDLSSSIYSFEKCYSLSINTAFQYAMLSQLYLAEAYLHRFKISQLENDLNETKNYMANVITICHEQDLNILPNVLFIQGLILMILDEYADAENFLEQAEKIAVEKLGIDITSKIGDYLIIIGNPALIKTTKIINEITEMIRKLAKYSYVKRTEKIPDLKFLIVFTSKAEVSYSIVFDEDSLITDVLINGLITVMKTMSTSSFGQGLRGIDYEGNKLLIENYENHSAILACEKDSFNARAKLVDFLKRYHSNFDEILRKKPVELAKEQIKQQADELSEAVFMRF